MDHTQQFIYLYNLIIQMFILAYVMVMVEKKKTTTKVYMLMVLSIIVLTVLEATSWLVLDKPGQVFKTLSVTVITLVYSLNALPMILGFTFFDYHVVGSDKVVKRRRFLYMVIWTMLICLNVSNLWSHFVFTVDEFNVYSRGFGMYLNVGIQYAVLLTYVSGTVKYLRSVSGRIIRMFLMFTFFPMLGSLIQVLYYGVPGIWPMYGLLMLFIFIFMIREDMRNDSLTLLYSRGQFDERLHSKLRHDKPFTIALIDLDEFKAVNDSFGHNEGDELLRTFARLLEDSVRKVDMVSRVGGDEFTLIIESESSAVGVQVLERIANNVKEFNETSTKSYKLEYSLGFQFVERPKDENLLELIGVIDERMYEQKNRHHACKEHK
ncbi:MULTISPECIES: GGDEF domain-containing protein [unclassified Fusibacter]|uniref:GGDEF domain-containing protein n=1 Tax=unclassified Fusibacter TaxID=2624464 RepID=UPI0010106EB5|nr:MULTISPECIES: GGDEF domain-containing protein [unclassified Fusibacter]MCK8060758.1 diguanylate cyclase [Fusibacter sp. A2]NPE23054.1 diguanylate cyclase [Fusibacter sp. A1]RXV59726.1 GGDEF domain-containing protein [Fusibacter sp. A1]